ncbi:hypothetical protein [Rufibacter sp. XAAS-G3-1]|uniref:hypothetical protein n=1 Tax=Rufibacter sp. XAAS-G3-1 TaxID=2729134 RepID=UPI0015E78521|nr:hypothetical protein [Rufibacter sp. XAAS-G3-1]
MSDGRPVADYNGTSAAGKPSCLLHIVRLRYSLTSADSFFQFLLDFRKRAANQLPEVRPSVFDLFLRNKAENAFPKSVAHVAGQFFLQALCVNSSSATAAGQGRAAFPNLY